MSLGGISGPVVSVFGHNVYFQGWQLIHQIDRLFSGPFTDRQGRFNYVEWAKVLRVNDGEEEREDKLKM